MSRGWWGGGRSWQVERDTAKYARKDGECGGERNSRERYFLSKGWRDEGVEK